MDGEVAKIIVAFQVCVRAAENAQNESDKILNMAKAVRYAEQAFAMMVGLEQGQGYTGYPCYTSGCTGEPHDGHRYSCCGKVGRISRHETWCPTNSRRGDG